jgi:hypothetical protein
MLEVGNVVPRDRHHAGGDTPLSAPLAGDTDRVWWGGTTPVGAEVLAGLIDLKERRHRSRTSSDISALDMRRDMGLQPTAI